MLRKKIRIIRKKPKSPKEKIKDFIKTTEGKLIISAIAVILILLLILAVFRQDSPAHFDYIGKEKRVEFLMQKTKSISKERIKHLLEEYRDGFCLFGVHRDTILYTELFGIPKKYQIEWEQTSFNTIDDKTEILLPPIDDIVDKKRILSRRITIKNDKEYSFNSINGTNILLKAIFERYPSYGSIVIIGIQERK